MKTNWSNVVAIGVMAMVIVAWLVWSKISHRSAPALRYIPAQEGVSYISHSNAPVTAAKPHPMPGSLTKRPSEFTEAEKEEFTNLFVTKLKPAAEKWFSVYSNRAPINLTDLTADKFVSQLGRDRTKHRAYTFVIGDVTFGIQEFRGATYVNYLASRQASMARITMPKLTSAPDLSMPVTREQVIDMVEADSGVRFPADEVSLKPTGASGSLMGGADAEVGKEVNNPLYTPYTTTSMDFSIVFGPDGKLAYYQRTP
jgi:hypothetical protein